MLEQPSLECKCGDDAVRMHCEDMEIRCIIPSAVAMTPQLPGSTIIFQLSTGYRLYILFNGADVLIGNKGRTNSHWGAK